MYFVKVPFFYRLLLRKALFKLPKDVPTLYLTFDDGPNDELTIWLTNFLIKHNIEATFFCTGNSILNNLSSFNTLINPLFSIGNHTFTHKNGWDTKTSDYLLDITKCQDILENYAQKYFSRPLFRPPFGKLTLSQYYKLIPHYDIILWHVLSGDFDNNSDIEKCWKNITSNIKNGSIIVLHDQNHIKEKVKTILIRIIETYQRDYIFRKLNY